MSLSRALWRGGLWDSQIYANGLWRGGLWNSQRTAVLSELQSLVNDLFGSGQQGLFAVFEPVVLGEQRLWQDAAGTVITDDDGEVIGNIDDLSPNNNDVFQTSAALKPVYKTDGTLHWALHDGVDDRMRSETGLNANVDEFWLFFAGEHAGGGSSVVFSLSELGSNFQYIRLDKTQIFVRAESSSTNQVTAAVTGTDTTAVWSIRARKSDRTVTIWRNRVQEAQVTAPGTDWFPQLFYLFTAGGKEGVASADTMGRGYIWVLDDLSASLVSRVEDYLADISGVTL